MADRENVFQWLKEKDFKNIINFLKNGKSQVADDAHLQQAVGYFFGELIGSNSSLANSETKYVFDQLFILHTKGFFEFTREQFEIIVTNLVRTATKKEEAYHYAMELPNNPTCIKIIAEYNESQPQNIEHDQSSKIHVHEVVSGNKNLATSIFNSKQERLFFLALRNCFPTHFLYPNFSLSTIIPATIRDSVLNPEEKRFIFNTTIDFLVVDQFNDFKPVIAVELDSEWHRLNNQEEKDAIKNKVLKASGLPLFRIEHFNKFKSVEDFEKAIIDTIKISR